MPAEQNYFNIEREMLAILFACEKLQIYTFGRKVLVRAHRSQALGGNFSEANQFAASKITKNAAATFHL